jgi:hypothetical protein
MARRKVGKLKPRYSFILNPYSDVRLSKCPRCDRPTHPRKFALLISIDGWEPLVLGKTCRYCTPCELIIAHQDELEEQLTFNLSRLAPEAIGNDYLVLGTMDRKVWQECLRAGGAPFDDALQHVAEFKKVFDLNITGGWVPRDPE